MPSELNFNQVSLTIRGNLLFDCPHAALQARGHSSLTFDHNVYYLTGDVGQEGQHGFVFHMTGDAYVYHNVAAWLDRGTQGYSEGYYLAPLDGALHLVMRNNVAFHCKSGIALVQGRVDLDLDYTGFYSNGSNYSNIARRLWGLHDVKSQPRFVDAPANDFRLEAASPYVDAGVYLPGIDDGYVGAAPDIGAYEFGAR